MKSSSDELNRKWPHIRLASMKAELRKRQTMAFAGYKPYAKQKLFHHSGKKSRERLLMAGNQLGKTRAASFEVAMHLTGQYPKWWRGRRFNRPIHAWASSLTSEATRDNPQRALLGESNSVLALPRGVEPRGGGLDVGTLAALPLGTVLTTTRAGSSAPGALDSIQVAHKSGGVSVLSFKSYSQGREKWQGPKLDLVWFDEEPPIDIYLEGLTRTNASGGMVMMTFTPLLGYSDVVQRFWDAKLGGAKSNTDLCVVHMTIDEVKHINWRVKKRIIASYPEYERDARTKGLPSMGSGRIFTTDEAKLKVKRFPIPDHWLTLGGIDFGWDHPTAAVKLAWDRDADHVYVVEAYRKAKQTPSVHAETIKGWGAALQIAWPHDGLQHDKGSGRSLAEVYSGVGLKMLPEHARMETGGNSLEASLMAWIERIDAGRFSVFENLELWFEEYRTYHRKEGKIVAIRDDLMSATRYALMSLRFGRLHRDVNGGEPRVGTVTLDEFDPLAW
ncbi:MAG: terminase large subunit domain-containing protein [Alphaproteobacteria bacterium]